jgi:hypothetical protein
MKQPADDRAAWLEALRFTRALEQVLAPGEGWRVEVRKDDVTVFRLEIRIEWLHAKCRSPKIDALLGGRTRARTWDPLIKSHPCGLVKATHGIAAQPKNSLYRQLLTYLFRCRAWQG